ncbi:MAG: lipocalin family protein [Weeksellaceae bacterium]|nr:lipocalin family protein [Weeksellaceae bacterium]
MRKNNLLLFSTIALSTLLFLSSCSVKVPEHVKPVSYFNSKDYSGKWYEIARFDFKYEKDMSNVTAEYTINEDGSIKVVNRGFDYIKNEWKEKIGKAKFNGPITQGALKVSFFGPFYAGYNVVAMDPNYQTALVFGESTDYIWILSRTKTISEETKQNYLKKAKEAGYDLDRLVWTEHDKD